MYVFPSNGDEHISFAELPLHGVLETLVGLVRSVGLDGNEAEESPHLRVLVVEVVGLTQALPGALVVLKQVARLAGTVPRLCRSPAYVD